MIDPTGLKEAGKVLKEALYDNDSSYPYTPAYFEFIASNVIGAYLTTRSGSSEFVVVDYSDLDAVLDVIEEFVDVSQIKEPEFASSLLQLTAALDRQTR